MPGGNEPLLPLQWQPVPGCGEAMVYPLIRKVDIVSSNSYLVQTPDAIVLIDPGGLPDQAAHLASIIRGIRGEKARPVIMMLTHAHVDHFLAACSDPLLADPGITLFAIQESGARSLESSDRQVTQAEMLGKEITPMRIDLRLLEAARERAGAPVRRTFANGATVMVVQDPLESGLPHERIVVGDGPPLDIFHTPGHSPDSICIRIGGLLFIGDLLVAANPGLAGIAGWNRDALIRSITGIQELLSRGGITAVCPGHGRVLTPDDTARMLGAVQGEARLLTGVAELNRDRARETAAFAEDCMEQVNELFTVMAGRLYYVSHVMDELGETEIAAGLPEMIRGEVIDDLLDSFASFTREVHSGRHMPIALALKGGQVIGKLQRTFDQEGLAQIIDPTLVLRAERLLGDYTITFRGFSLPRDIAEHDLNALLRASLTDHTVRSSSDDDVLASADDHAAFGRLLLARIGTSPLLGDVEVTFGADSKTLTVPVDRERFLDLLTYLLEDLVGTGAKAITIHTGKDGDTTVVTISGAGCTGRPGGGIPRRFLSGLCERAGGTLDSCEAAGSRQFTIRFGTVL